jgi:hypothetical protein
MVDEESLGQEKNKRWAQKKRRKKKRRFQKKGRTILGGKCAKKDASEMQGTGPYTRAVPLPSEDSTGMELALKQVAMRAQNYVR